jgi:hypothetical protein
MTTKLLDDTTTGLLRAALALEGEPSALADVKQGVHDTAGALHDRAEAALRTCRDANDVERAVRDAVAAIELSLAARALESATEWQARAGAAGDPAARANAALGARQLMRAAAALNRPTVTVAKLAADAPVLPLPADANGPPSTQNALEGPVDLHAQRNIAAYHREHERFYTQAQCETAVDLFRESNKLKVLAGVWLGAPGADVRPAVDFSRDEYRAVGSVDLNSRHSIANIGVLFMEGEGEPTELMTMKLKLRALAGATMRAGSWLSEKMQAAWKREQNVFSQHDAQAGAVRFNTIGTNWRGARYMHLAGRVLALGVELLSRQDLSSAGVRRDRAAAARVALNAAWIVAMAAQLEANSGMELADNDRSWTAFLEMLPAGPPREGRP